MPSIDLKVGKGLTNTGPDGLVIGETAYNEIGFEEADAVAKLTAIFKKMEGGSLVLFHEKGGELTDMKKLY